jgi:hypothetical protein
VPTLVGDDQEGLASAVNVEEGEEETVAVVVAVVVSGGVVEVVAMVWGVIPWAGDDTSMAWMGSVILCGFGWSGVVEMVDVGMATLPPWDWDGAAAAVE